MTIDARQGTGIRAHRSTTAQQARVASTTRTIAPSRARRAESPVDTTTSDAAIRAGVVETAAHEEIVLERMTPDVLRVTLDGRTLGFVEHVGRVNVALSGERYDRAVEVAQTLDVDSAARALV